MAENLRSLAGAQHFPLGSGDACRSCDACHGGALVRFPLAGKVWGWKTPCFGSFQFEILVSLNSVLSCRIEASGSARDHSAFTKIRKR
jgi:hypothetical protein